MRVDPEGPEGVVEVEDDQGREGEGVGEGCGDWVGGGGGGRGGYEAFGHCEGEVVEDWGEKVEEDGCKEGYEECLAGSEDGRQPFTTAREY